MQLPQGRVNEDVKSRCFYIFTHSHRSDPAGYVDARGDEAINV